MKDYKYQEVYKRIIEDIESGYLKYHDKIPSIRSMAKSANISRTTIENAYLQLLLEGYIYSKEKVGYFVDVKYDYINAPSIDSNKEIVIKKHNYLYDFSGSYVDDESFNLDIWKKYIKRALLYSEDLMCYGDPYGEPILKEVLQTYSREYRGVRKPINNYIIGAGFQTMLYHICGLFPPETVVAIEEGGFKQAEVVFNDCHMLIRKIPVDEEGIDINQIDGKDIKLLYLNSSSGGYHGHPIKQKRRLEIIDYAKKNNIYIIEDDHNGELKFNTKPIDAMSKVGGDNVIYIGSFSKLLLPSIRISYMALPNSLVKQYLDKFSYFHQTASKLEQIALALYIKDGQLSRHLKRLRKHYADKGNFMLFTLKETFPQYSFKLYETPLKITMSLSKDKIDNYIELAKAHNILVNKNSYNEIALSFSGIKQKDINQAIQLLSNIWK